MSKEDRIWREGDPRWEWIQGEPVPRYMWSQVPRSFVVGRLNHTSELEQRVEAQRDTIRNIRAIFHQYLRKTKEVRLDLLAREKDCRELQQQVEALTKRLQRARLDTVEFIHDEIIDGSETANEARRDVFNYYLKLQLEGKSKQEPVSD